MKKILAILSSLIIFGGIAFAWTGANNTEFVVIGNAGNVADSNGYGAVGYEYSIGKYEVSNAQYVKFMNAVGSNTVSVAGNDIKLYTKLENTTYGGITQSGTTFESRSGCENKAVNYVNAYAAAMYTNWLTNGAKTEGLKSSDYLAGVYDFTTASGASISVFTNADRSQGYMITAYNEWYKAAYYNPETETYYKFATQSNTAPAAIGVKVGETVAAENSANYSNVNTSNGYISDVGSYINSDSYYGTFDQNGNVWEWTDTPYTSGNSNLGILGGAFNNSSSDLSFRQYDVPQYSRLDYGVGFRVASSVIPEPSTYAAIFGALALGFVIYRKRK